MRTYTIAISGIQTGFDLEAVLVSLSSLFNINKETLRPKFNGMDFIKSGSMRDLAIAATPMILPGIPIVNNPLVQAAAKIGFSKEVREGTPEQREAALARMAPYLLPGTSQIETLAEAGKELYQKAVNDAPMVALMASPEFKDSPTGEDLKTEAEALFDQAGLSSALVDEQTDPHDVNAEKDASDQISRMDHKDYKPPIHEEGERQWM